MANGTVGAPAGNKNGLMGKDCAEVVRQALARYTNSQLKVSRGTALHRVFKMLIDKALINQDVTAAEVILNRLWGKPKQQVDLTADDGALLAVMFATAQEMRAKLQAPAEKDITPDRETGA